MLLRVMKKTMQYDREARRVGQVQAVNDDGKLSLQSLREQERSAGSLGHDDMLEIGHSSEGKQMRSALPD